MSDSSAIKITCIIVDDEPHARQAMLRALEPHDNLQVLAECENGLEAVKAVHEHQPQLMFLDIHMPKLDGFDVLDLLGPQAPKVVFITAYDEYAVKAFEANAIDYLLKPLDPARLNQCIDKIYLRVSQVQEIAEVESGDESLEGKNLEEKDSSNAIAELVKLIMK